MAVMALPRQWSTAKPPPRATINRAHPLAVGLVSSLLFAEGGGYGIDGVSHKQWTTGGNAPLWVPGGVQFSGAANDRIMSAFASGNGATGGFTIDGLIRIAGTSNNGSYIRFGGYAAGDRGICLGIGSNGGDFDAAGDYLLGLSDNVAWIRPTTGVQVPRDRWVHIAITYSSAGAYAIYFEGRQVGTGSVGIANAPIYTLTVGADNANVARVPNGGRVATARAWLRTLTPSEIRWLAAEPYAIYTPPGPRLRQFGLDTSTISITGTGGLTGGSGALAGAGTITITGMGTLVGSTGAIAAAGTETISGDAALTGSSGALAVEGTETIEGAATLAGSAGTLLAEGTETIAGAGTLTGTTGLLEAAGAETISGAATLAGSSGALAAAGYQATLAPVGTVTLHDTTARGIVTLHDTTARGIVTVADTSARGRITITVE